MNARPHGPGYHACIVISVSLIPIILPPLLFAMYKQSSTHTATTIPSWFYTCHADTLSSSSSVSSLSSLSKRSICRSFFLSFRTTVSTHCTSITSSEQLAIARFSSTVHVLNRTTADAVNKGLWPYGWGSGS